MTDYPRYAPLAENPQFKEHTNYGAVLPVAPSTHGPPFFNIQEQPTPSSSSSSSATAAAVSNPEGPPRQIVLAGSKAEPSGAIILSEEEKRLMRRRCALCHKFYSNADTDLSCFYHPGVFVEPTSCLQGTMIGWTCCRYGDEFNFFVDHPMAKLKVLKHDATDKNCRGCKFAERHQEDTTYTSIMASFPFDAEGAQRDILQREQEERELAKKKQAASAVESAPTLMEASPKSPKPEDNPDYPFWVHDVKPTDTLEGVAIRYGVTAGAIQRANRLATRDVYHLKNLLILKTLGSTVPPPVQAAAILGDDPKLAMRKRFCAINNTTMQEAAYYLDLTNYDFDAAVSEFKDDAQWEQNNPKGDKKKRHRH